jgi:hypothetical protein
MLAFLPIQCQEICGFVVQPELNSSIPIVIKGGGNHVKGPSQKAASAEFLLYM